MSKYKQHFQPKPKIQPLREQASQEPTAPAQDEAIVEESINSAPAATEPMSMSSSENKPAAAPLAQITQQLNLLLILCVALFVFNLFLFWKIQNIEKNGTPAAAKQEESALSVENLKKTAKDLKLDTNKFDQCLDKNTKKDVVAANITEGNGIGVRGTPGFFVNGKFLGGAFPFEFFKEIIDREIAGTGSTLCTDYSTELQKYCSDEQNKAFDPAPKEMNLANTPIKGKADAKVTIVEYSDFQCPFCIRAFATVEQVLKAYPNDVKLAFKQYPLTQIHPFAQKAAEASLCANDQGKFWQFHDKLFTSQGQAQ